LEPNLNFQIWIFEFGAPTVGANRRKKTDEISARKITERLLNCQTFLKLPGYFVDVLVQDLPYRLPLWMPHPILSLIQRKNACDPNHEYLFDLFCHLHLIQRGKRLLYFWELNNHKYLTRKRIGMVFLFVLQNSAWLVLNVKSTIMQILPWIFLLL